MSAVSQIDPHASAPPPITTPAPSRGSAWNYALEREGWTSLLIFGDALASLAAVLIAIAVTDTPGVTDAQYAPAVRAAGGRAGDAARTRRLPQASAYRAARAVADAGRDLGRRHGGADLRHRDPRRRGIAPLIGWSWLLTILLLAGARCVLALARRQARIKGLAGKPTLIVGAGVVGRSIAQRLTAQPEYGLQPVGFLDENPPANGDGNGEPTATLLTSPRPGLSRRSGRVAEYGAEHVIFAFTSNSDQSLLTLARSCEQLGLEVSLVPRLFESMNDRVALDWVGSLPVLGIRPLDPKGWQFRVKYALDRPLALLGLLVLSPLMLVLAVAVKLSSPRPDPVPPAPHRPGRPHLRDVEVPLHARPRRGREVRAASGLRPGRRGGSRTGARRSGASCAAAASTSCRSCSTCCAAR